ncbi:MAG: toxin-antitoxin system HicB family antitoxin [Holophaga sp.]|nr:toxin-antitoxin system HicB family antitoxin [Holophaga sp.]
MKDSTYGFRVVWSQEDDAFVATCPEFEGVSGFGPTQEEALAEAKVSLELAIETYLAEGWELPRPETMQAHRGQFLARVPPSLHARLAQRAADEGVSMNSLVLAYLAQGLGETEGWSKMKAEILNEIAKSLGAGTGKILTATSSLRSNVPYAPSKRSALAAWGRDHG